MLLGDRVPSLTCFNLGFLTGISLQESIEFLWLAPAAFIIVIEKLPGGKFADDRITPIRHAGGGTIRPRDHL